MRQRFVIDTSASHLVEAAEEHLRAAMNHREEGKPVAPIPVKLASALGASGEMASLPLVASGDGKKLETIGVERLNGFLVLSVPQTMKLANTLGLNSLPEAEYQSVRQMAMERASIERTQPQARMSP